MYVVQMEAGPAGRSTAVVEELVAKQPLAISLLRQYLSPVAPPTSPGLPQRSSPALPTTPKRAPTLAELAGVGRSTVEGWDGPDDETDSRRDSVITHGDIRC